MRKHNFFLVLSVLLHFTIPATAQFDDSIRKGLAFLRNAAPKENKVGVLAIAGLAIAKAGDNHDDPVLQNIVAKVVSKASGNPYQAEDNHAGNYETAVIIMLLAAVDGDKYLAHIQAMTNYLISRQNPNGSWDYPGGTGGDTSQSQYAILGMWEAAGAGVNIPPKAWDTALEWFILTQSTGGAFTYHPKNPSDDNPVLQEKVNHSMTVAGTAAMLICREHLNLPGPKSKAKDRPLLIPVPSASNEDYKPKITSERANKAIEAGTRWLTSKFTIADAKWPYGPKSAMEYYIYGLERFAAISDIKTIAGIDWYSAGGKHLESTQAGDGSWNSLAQIPDTALALLFLGRSTQKTINRIRISTLGKGTMIGGRGMPSAEGAVSIEEARRKARFQRALRVPAGDLLKILDEPDSPDVERAAAALETIDSKDLVKAVGGNMQKLRRLTRDERPGVRRGAIWALARTKDYRVVPVLIESLDDPAFLVYQAARDALCYISRRIDGFGLPAGRQPNAQQLADATKKWKDWFTSLKVQVDPEQEFDD